MEGVSVRPGNGAALTEPARVPGIPPGTRFKRLRVPDAVFDNAFRQQMERSYGVQVEMVEQPHILRTYADELAAKRRKNYLKGQLSRFLRRARGCPTIVNLGTARDNALSDSSKRVMKRLAARSIELWLGESNGAGDCGMMGFNSEAHAEARHTAGCGPDRSPLIHVPLYWLCGPEEVPEPRSTLGTDGYRCPPLFRFQERTPALLTAGEPVAVNAFEPGFGTDEETIEHLLACQMGKKNGIMYVTRPEGTKPPLHLIDPFLPEFGEYLYEGWLHHRRNQFRRGTAGTISAKDLENIFVLRIGEPQPSHWEVGPVAIRYFPSEVELAEFILGNAYACYLKLRAAYSEINRQPPARELVRRN